MRRLFVCATAVMFATASTGCILSRLTDRAFVGFHTKRPLYTDRKVTGLFLLPITFAIDVATFPIQAILIAIAGDDFVMGKDEPDPTTVMLSLNTNPAFERLGEAQKQRAVAELDALISSGQLTRGTALALTDEGHWVAIEATDEAKAQMIARASAGALPEAIACTP